ncbi:MAG: hypothetical protein ACOH1V_02130 [Stenotrophomonas sp.]
MDDLFFIAGSDLIGAAGPARAEVAVGDMQEGVHASCRRAPSFWWRTR